MRALHAQMEAPRSAPQPVPKIVPVRPLGTSLEHRKGPLLHALFEVGKTGFEPAVAPQLLMRAFIPGAVMAAGLVNWIRPSGSTTQICCATVSSTAARKLSGATLRPARWLGTTAGGEDRSAERRSRLKVVH
jgi:hypothetical protein